MTDAAPSAADLAVAQLRLDEGFESASYPDALSALGKACTRAGLPLSAYRQITGWTEAQGAPWTIGYGYAQDVHPGDTWSQTQAITALMARVASLDSELSNRIPTWSTQNAVRQSVLLGMGYNDGVTGLLGFKQMLAKLESGDYDGAADECLDSKSARELPARYGRYADRLRSGTIA